MYLLKLKVKSTSKFDLALEDVKAYCRDTYLPETRKIMLAGWSPKTRTINVFITENSDLEYVTRDLTYYEPGIGAYNRLSAAVAYHITNDVDCDCTPCQEGGLDLLFNNPNNTSGKWKSVPV